MLAIAIIAMSVVTQTGTLVPHPNSQIAKGDEVYLYRRDAKGKLSDIPGTEDILDYWKMYKFLLANDTDGLDEMVKEKKIAFYSSGTLVRVLDIKSQDATEVRILEADVSKPSKKVIYVYKLHARHCEIVYPGGRRR